MAAPKGNLFALGNNGGRPAKYETPEELEKEIDGFFQYCQTEEQYPTVCGLSLYLGFNSRQSLYNYRDKKDNGKEFLDLIKRALSFIEMHYETRLNSQACTGAIFALKNMGWRDKTEVEQTNRDVTLQQWIEGQNEQNSEDT